MRAQCQILSEDERQKIHDESIKILQQVGVKFLSQRALKIMNDNGAKVDHDTGIAKIPAEMVEQALKTAPKSFVLGSPGPRAGRRPAAPGQRLRAGSGRRVHARFPHRRETIRHAAGQQRRHAGLRRDGVELRGVAPLDSRGRYTEFGLHPLDPPLIHEQLPARSGRIRRAGGGALHLRGDGGDPGQRRRRQGEEALFGHLLHAGAAGARRRNV